MNMKAFGAAAFVMVVIQLSILGFLGWVIVSLLRHFGVI